jgi:hypothetical protein
MNDENEYNDAYYGTIELSDGYTLHVSGGLQSRAIQVGKPATDAERDGASRLVTITHRTLEMWIDLTDEQARALSAALIGDPIAPADENNAR